MLAVMEIHQIAAGKIEIKDSSFQFSDSLIAVCDVRTAKYLDGNKKFFDIFKMDKEDLRQMDCFDTLYPGRKNKQRLERFYKQARLYDAAESFIKHSIDGKGELISYLIQTRVIDAGKKLLFSTVTPCKAFKHR
jgi:hypothetical protein